MAFFFFSESRCLSKCCVLANLIGKPPHSGHVISSMIVSPYLCWSILDVGSAVAEALIAKSLIWLCLPFFILIPATAAGHSKSCCAITLFLVAVNFMAFIFAHVYTASYTALVYTPYPALAMKWSSLPLRSLGTIAALVLLLKVHPLSALSFA